MKEIMIMRFLSLSFAALFGLFSLATCVEGLEVLVVDGAVEVGADFQSLSENIDKVRGEEVNYTRVVSTDVIDETLEDYDVVWFSHNSNSLDGVNYRKDDGVVIAEYVDAGGIVLTTASDNGGWNSDWLPAAVSELDTGDYDIEITDEGKELFSNPNDVGPADPVMDERFAAIDEAWTVLAWGAGMEGSEAGAIQIAHGEGFYILVCLDTRSAGVAAAGLPLMENMLNYAVIQTPVAPAGKLATTWGQVKE